MVHGRSIWAIPLFALSSVAHASLLQTCSEYYKENGRAAAAPNAARWCSEGEYWPFKSPSNGDQQVSLFTRCTPAVDATDDAQTVLISHGWPTSSWDWQSVVAELEEHGVRACSVDFVGFGFSEKPRPPFVYSMFDQAKALHEFAIAKGLQNFTLATHDMGDSIGLIFLQRYASLHNISFHLVLNGSLKLAYANITRGQRALLSNVTGPAVEKLIRPDVMANGLAQNTFTPPAGTSYAEELATVLAFENETEVLHDTIQYLNERAEHEDEWLVAWSESSVPSGLLWGQLDKVATPQLGDYLWRNVLANRSSAPAWYAKVPEANHYIVGDHPKLVAQVLLEGGAPPSFVGGEQS